MIIKHSYPNIKKELNVFFFLKFLYSLVALVATVICLVVNIIVGGPPWVLFVIGGEIIFYYMFFRIDLIDNTVIKKVMKLVIAICIYLKIIDMIIDTDWSLFVDSIILFSLLIFQTGLYIIGIRIHKRKLIPLLGLAIAAIIIFLLGIFNVIELKWPIIVLGVLGITVVLFLFIFMHKTTFSEIRKYFSIR